MFPTLALGGLSALGAYGWHWGSKEEKRIERLKGHFASNVVKYDQLDQALKSKDNTSFMMELDNKEDVGVLDLHKQEIHTTTKTTPYTEVGIAIGTDGPHTKVESGYRTTQEQDIAFSYWPFKTYYINANFKKDNIVQSDKFQSWSVASHKASLTTETESGEKMRANLLKKFNLNLGPAQLFGSKVYQYKYHSLQGRTVYFAGKKVGSKYFYHHVDTDPETLINKEFAPDEDVASVCKWGGGICFVGFALLAGASKM